MISVASRSYFEIPRRLLTFRASAIPQTESTTPFTAPDATISLTFSVNSFDGLVFRSLYDLGVPPKSLGQKLFASNPAINRVQSQRPNDE